MPSSSPSRVDPIEQLATDRAAAHEQKDAWAALCTLGTVNAEGDAELRTLVLRELDGQLALFFSAHSPKWAQMKVRPTCSVQLYLPSIQVQYRVRARWTLIDPDLVHTSWVMRPDIPKKLDWLYEQQPQSTAIDREELLQKLAPESPVPAAAPNGSMGVYLEPERIERLQLSSGVHERECWQLASGAWRHEHMIP